MATAKQEVLTALEIDLSTGIETIRELTAKELAQREADKAEADLRQSERDAKAAARQSALAKLAELGLTEEEIAAL